MDSAIVCNRHRTEQPVRKVVIVDKDGTHKDRLAGLYRKNRRLQVEWQEDIHYVLDQSKSVDLLVLDIDFPSHFNMMPDLVDKFLKILILSHRNSCEFVGSLIKKGASGFLLKSAGFQKVTEAIEAMLHYDAYLPPGAAGYLLEAIRYEDRVNESDLLEREKLLFLTDREFEVYQWMIRGQSNQKIGETLFLSPLTVKRHVHNLQVKLNAHNRSSAVAMAYKKYVRGAAFNRSANEQKLG